MSLPSYKLILSFGLGIAAVTFVFWTVLGYLRFEAWTPDGLFRAVFVLGAVLLLAAVLRLVRWAAGRSSP